VGNSYYVEMKNRRHLTVTTAVFFLSSIGFGALAPSVANADGPQLQLTPDSNTQWVMPDDPGIHREVIAKNTGDALGIWSMHVSTSASGEVICMPQPQFLYLAPGATERVECGTDFALLEPDSNSWLPGQTHSVTITLAFYAGVYSGNDPPPGSPVATVVLNNTITGGWPVNLNTTNGPPPDLEPHDATIAIKVVDAAGESIGMAQIAVTNEETRWVGVAQTNYSGNATDFPVTAHLRPYFNNWDQFSIDVSSTGYADAHVMVVPHSGQTVPVTVVMHPPTVTASYQLALDYDTGMPAARSAVSADGRYLVTAPHLDGPPAIPYTEAHSSIDFFDLQTATHLWSYPLGSTILGVDVSADGQYVAAPYQGYFTTQAAKDYIILLDHQGNLVWKYQVNASDGTALPVTWAGIPTNAPPAGGVFTVKFSPDGKSLAFGTINGFLTVLNTKTEAVESQTFLREQVRQISWSPDGSTLYASVGDNNTYAVDVNSGKILWQTDTGGWSLLWSVSKDYALVSAKEGTAITLLNLSDGAIVWQYPASAASFGLAISSDQTRFASVNDTGASPGIAVFDAHGNVIWSIGTTAVGASWSGDGKYLLVEQNPVAVPSGQTNVGGPPPTVNKPIDGIDLYTRDGELVWSKALDTPNGPWDHGECGVTYLSQDATTLVVGDQANGHVYIYKGKLTVIPVAPAPKAQPTTAVVPAKTGRNLVMILVGVAVLILLAGIVLIIVERRKKSNK
jgi:WD40 repeat protein